jgi:hypothetical protein
MSDSNLRYVTAAVDSMFMGLWLFYSVVVVSLVSLVWAAAWYNVRSDVASSKVKIAESEVREMEARVKAFEHVKGVLKTPQDVRLIMRDLGLIDHL